MGAVQHREGPGAEGGTREDQEETFRRGTESQAKTNQRSREGNRRDNQNPAGGERGETEDPDTAGQERGAAG